MFWFCWMLLVVFIHAQLGYFTHCPVGCPGGINANTHRDAHGEFPPSNEKGFEGLDPSYYGGANGGSKDS